MTQCADLSSTGDQADLDLSHEPEEAACTASSTGAARCRMLILPASPATVPTKLSSLCRSPGWNKHALTKDLQIESSFSTMHLESLLSVEACQTIPGSQSRSVRR